MSMLVPEGVAPAAQRHQLTLVLALELVQLLGLHRRNSRDDTVARKHMIAWRAAAQSAQPRICTKGPRLAACAQEQGAGLKRHCTGASLQASMLLPPSLHMCLVLQLLLCFQGWHVPAADSTGMPQPMGCPHYRRSARQATPGYACWAPGGACRRLPHCRCRS